MYMEEEQLLFSEQVQNLPQIYTQTPFKVYMYMEQEQPLFPKQVQNSPQMCNRNTIKLIYM